MKGVLRLSEESTGPHAGGLTFVHRQPTPSPEAQSQQYVYEAQLVQRARPSMKEPSHTTDPPPRMHGKAPVEGERERERED